MLTTGATWLQNSLADTHAKERELNASQVEIEVLQAEKSRREPVVKQLVEKTVEEDARLKQLLADSQRQRSTQEQQLHELQQGLAMYQKLGLFFEHTEGECNAVPAGGARKECTDVEIVIAADRIVVRFTQIDAQNPSREFSFRITIDPITDKYIGEMAARLLVREIIKTLTG